MKTVSHKINYSKCMEMIHYIDMLEYVVTKTLSRCGAVNPDGPVMELRRIVCPSWGDGSYQPWEIMVDELLEEGIEDD